MAQNISIWGANYTAVPAVTLPKTGGGSATFTDTSDANATADDILEGKTAYVNGTKLTGTGQGGGGGSSSDAYDLIIKCNGAGFTNVVSDYQIVKGSLATILTAKEQNTLITGVCHSLVKNYDDEEDVTNDTYSIARLIAINDNYSGQTYPGYSSSAQLVFVDFNNKKRVSLTVNDEEMILGVYIGNYLH